MTKGFFLKKKDLDLDLREYLITLRGMREKVDAPIMASDYSTMKYEDNTSRKYPRNLIFK